MGEKAFELSEVLSALSYVLDMVEGQPAGHALRSCFIGMTVGERFGLSEEKRSALFYALLLKDAGCSNNSSRVADLFEADDFEVKRNFKTVDWSRYLEAARYAARNVSPGGTAWSRLHRFLSVGKVGQRGTGRLIRLRCEQGAQIARLIGFPEETADAIYSLDEHWDGRGHPNGLRGEEIPLLSRICSLAQTVEVFYSEFGPQEAKEMAGARRERWFDPQLVDVFLHEAREERFWQTLADPDLPNVIAHLEPADRTLHATPERLDSVAHAFAGIIDAKSPFTYQHSERVATVSASLAAYMGFPDHIVHDQWRAGLLHDIGKLGISSRILDKPAPLTGEEFTKVKEHPALTHQVLARVAPFRDLADLAAAHHERLDGSGYYRGLTAEELSVPARILAVADVFDALSSPRPYRPPMHPDQVFTTLRSGSLCQDCVDALATLDAQGELNGHTR